MHIPVDALTYATLAATAAVVAVSIKHLVDPPSQEKKNNNAK
jgi:hypothetical protein